MKKILLIVAMCIFTSLMCNAQSISASKIMKYIENQKQTEIAKELLSMGFVYDGKETNNNMTMYSYSKKANNGLEKLTIGYNDELFIVHYKPTTNEIYSSIKEKMLTSDFGYSYSYKTTKYYENGSMRIGVNDTSKSISFFAKKIN